MKNPYWPFFELRVRTPRLELRYPDDDDAVALAALAAKGIHPPDFMPFTHAWTDVASPELELKAVQHFWLARANLTPENWALPMAVVVDGAVVGVQDMHAPIDFRVTRLVSTGSWLGMPHQGQGLGKEMRAAVLHLAFAGLGAEVAISAAFLDNASSIGVSRSLGYEDDGYYICMRRGEAARQIRFRLERAAWEQRRRDDIVIEGLEPCLPVLGLGAA